jgi:hypothetical protein
VVELIGDEEVARKISRYVDCNVQSGKLRGTAVTGK